MTIFLLLFLFYNRGISLYSNTEVKLQPTFFCLCKYQNQTHLLFLSLSSLWSLASLYLIDILETLVWPPLSWLLRTFSSLCELLCGFPWLYSDKCDQGNLNISYSWTKLPDHLICLLRNLYAGQEATVRTGHGTTVWFQIGKGVCQGCILSPCLFNLYAEYIKRNAGLEETQAGIKIAGRNINNLRYADDPTLMAESEEKLKSLLMKVKVG